MKEILISGKNGYIAQQFARYLASFPEKNGMDLTLTSLLDLIVCMSNACTQTEKRFSVL